jgi:hypothetical protein
VDTKDQRKKVPDTSEHDPSATRVSPDQFEHAHEGSHAPTDEAAPEMAHMGATEDEVIREKPPTDVIEDLLNSPGGDKDKADKHAPNDELTPG